MTFLLSFKLFTANCVIAENTSALYERGIPTLSSHPPLRRLGGRDRDFSEASDEALSRPNDGRTPRTRVRTLILCKWRHTWTRVRHGLSQGPDACIIEICFAFPGRSLANELGCDAADLARSVNHNTPKYRAWFGRFVKKRYSGVMISISGMNMCVSTYLSKEMTYLLGLTTRLLKWSLFFVESRKIETFRTFLCRAG